MSRSVAEQLHGMEETESGLIVPTGTVEKKIVTWTYEDYRMVHRAQKEMSKPHNNAMVFLLCNECKTQIASELNEITQEHQLACKCTVRRVA